MVDKLSNLARTALDSEDVKRSFLKQGATPMWLGPEDAAAYRAADARRLAPVVKASGAKVD
jgi:tripartite-type tricarboxylate transporter receptor subunit TctC